MEQEVTSFEDLGEMVRNAPEFKYIPTYSPHSRIGEVSTETLKAEYGGGIVGIQWQWPGKFDERKGFRDECLNCVFGHAKGKLGVGLLFYHHNNCDYRDDSKIREMASIARQRYLSQIKT